MGKQLYKDIDGMLGDTPMVTLNHLPETGGASIHAKLDYYNPGRSVKDRIVWNMIRDAEKRGLLKPRGTIIEPTSGNTSISLAVHGRHMGYEVIIVMPDINNSGLQERLKLLGAKLELTPPDEGLRGAREKVQKLCGKNSDYFYPDQFNNSSNPEIHRNRTAREIIKAMGTVAIDAFVSAVGTGGTITGVGEVLKAKNPDIKIIAVEPSESPVLSGGRPGSHSISGIGAGFIPPLLNMDIIDSVETVSSLEAKTMTEKIWREEGLLVGISSGAALVAAKRIASGMKKNNNVVAFFADAMPGVC